MSKVRFTVDLTIHEGKLDACEAIVRAMIAASQKEPGTLGYDWYLSGDRKRCRLLETYADADAAFAHLTGPAVTEFVPKVLTVASVAGFEIYGDPGAKSAAILAGFGAETFSLWHAFSR